MTSTLPAPPGLRPYARHRGLFWFALMLALFALVGGGYLAVSTYLSRAEPGDVVTSYFTAVAHGDAPRALSFGPVPAAEKAYLTSGVLKDQLAVGAITDFQVLSVTRDGARARVNVSYQLRGPRGNTVVTDVVPMIRKNQHWWLAQSAVSTKVSLAQAAQRAAFAGTAFPTGSVLLFPGALPITFDTPNLELATAGSTVQFSTAENSALAVEASATGITAARAAVGTALQACLAGTSTDAFCPVPGNGSSTLRAVPGSLRGQLADKSLGSLAVTVAPDAAGKLRIDGTVSVDGTYQSLSYTNNAAAVTDPKISVMISAQCYASAATTTSWVTS